jgi:hypothetical protein
LECGGFLAQSFEGPPLFGFNPTNQPSAKHATSPLESHSHHSTHPTRLFILLRIAYNHIFAHRSFFGLGDLGEQCRAASLQKSPV